MTAIETFTPMVLNQIGITVLCFLALGIGVQVSSRLKRIRRRWGLPESRATLRICVPRQTVAEQLRTVEWRSYSR